MVLMRDGSYLIPVCGFGKAKVDSSVFTVGEGGIVKKKEWGEDCFRRAIGISSPMCTVFLLGSSGWGLRSCVLATSYASGGKYFIVGKER